MNKSFMSMLSVTIMLILIVISTVANANVRAQEVATTDVLPEETVIAPYEPRKYRECEIDDYETQIFDAVLEENESLQSYNIKELRYLNCYYDYENQEKLVIYSGFNNYYWRNLV